MSILIFIASNTVLLTTLHRGHLSPVDTFWQQLSLLPVWALQLKITSCFPFKNFHVLFKTAWPSVIQKILLNRFPILIYLTIHIYICRYLNKSIVKSLTEALRCWNISSTCIWLKYNLLCTGNIF